MLEIEIKAYCDDLDRVVKGVISLGGSLLKRTTERDIYFNHPCRDFANTDEAFRIRIEDKKKILTYKGPKLDKKTKTRFEEEVEFNDFDSMRSILLNLGFVEVDEVVKKRDMYILNDILICIDRVEDVGHFVELEKRGIDKVKVKVENELFNLAKKIGISRFESKSYLELKLEKK